MGARRLGGAIFSGKTAALKQIERHSQQQWQRYLESRQIVVEAPRVSAICAGRMLNNDLGDECAARENEKIMPARTQCLVFQSYEQTRFLRLFDQDPAGIQLPRVLS